MLRCRTFSRPVNRQQRLLVIAVRECGNRIGPYTFRIWQTRTLRTDVYGHRIDPVRIMAVFQFFTYSDSAPVFSESDEFRKQAIMRQSIRKRTSREFQFKIRFFSFSIQKPYDQHEFSPPRIV